MASGCRPLKIGFVYDVIFPYVVGGMQLRNWELARRLAQRGHDVTLFGMKHWDGPDAVMREGVRLCGIYPSANLYTKNRRAFWPPVRFGLAVTPMMIRGDFDIIDVANFPYFSCFSARLGATITQAKLVVTWIEVWGSYWREYLGVPGQLAEIVEKATTNLTSNVVAISEMTKRDLHSLGFAGSVQVIPCGVDLIQTSITEPSTERIDILFSGRLIKDKNIDLLVRAVARLVPSFPAIHCVIIGDGPERTAIEALVERLELKSNIVMRPFATNHAEVFSMMKAAKVFALPSTREGFGIVAVEANACGIPVVTIDHPRNAARELIIDGVNGHLSRLDDGDLADKLALALTEGGARRESCLLAAQAYDWDRIADTMEEFYARQL